jgi:hypothetical protein
MVRTYLWPWRRLLEPLVSGVVYFSTKIYVLGILRCIIHYSAIRRRAGFKT